MSNGKIYVVGIGPGNMEDISIRAYNILKNINRYKFTYISIAAIIQLMLICSLWLISRIFQLALTLAGEEHLDKNNILHILTNPYSFVILNLLVLNCSIFYVY